MPRPIKDEIDLPLFREASRRFVTISELNELVKNTLEARLDALWVQGEISNLRVPPSGHYYFTLKDDQSQICAVMFRRQGVRLRFAPENGMAVLCHGQVSIYAARGDLQLYVDDIEPQGQGALYVAFEQLKKKLAAEGLFAAERKRALPFLPRAIGIVTSDRGAALHDILRILGDRFPNRRVVVRPVKVQGDRAAQEIASAIRDLNRLGGIEANVTADLAERHAPFARLRHPPGRRDTGPPLELVSVDELLCDLRRRLRAHQVLLEHVVRQLERAEARERDHDDAGTHSDCSMSLHGSS